MAPTQTRLPMIEFIKSSRSGLMTHQGWRMMALYNELSFSTYCRPAERLRAHAVDVVPRNWDYHHHVLVLSPFERDVSSKAGVFDEVLILDDTRVPWLGDLLVKVARDIQSVMGEEASLWNFSAAQYLKVWRACVACLAAEAIAESPYQSRHGGASRDHLLKLRSVGAIQKKGRWSADASARIYDKPGRLQQTVNKFSSELEPFGEEIRQNFVDFFSGKKRMLLPAKIRARIPANFKTKSS